MLHVDSQHISVAENLGGGGGGGVGGTGAPTLRIAMNNHSMKLFNNLIKNTLLAPMFCGLIKSFNTSVYTTSQITVHMM